MASGRFAGADFQEARAKWRCPAGECQPKSKWVKGSRRNPDSARVEAVPVALQGPGSIEREFGRLKNEYGLGRSAFAVLNASHSTSIL